jgi:hypothetical protein
METLWACTGSGRIEIELTREQANSVFHSGPCDDDVAALRSEPAIAAQLASIDPATLRDELREYGAWEDDELQDHEANLDRILWLLASDAAEEAFLAELGQ